MEEQKSRGGWIFCVSVEPAVYLSSWAPKARYKPQRFWRKAQRMNNRCGPGESGKYLKPRGRAITANLQEDESSAETLVWSVLMDHKPVLDNNLCMTGWQNHQKDLFYWTKNGEQQAISSLSSNIRMADVKCDFKATIVNFLQ